MRSDDERVYKFRAVLTDCLPIYQNRIAIVSRVFTAQEPEISVPTFPFVIMIDSRYGYTILRRTRISVNCSIKVFQIQSLHSVL